MNDDQDASLSKRAVSPGLIKSSGSSNPIVRRMADDIALRATNTKETESRYLIGKYHFSEPDFKQITRWANCFGLTPLELVSIFEETRLDLGGVEAQSLAIEFEVIDGCISTLCWDFGKLPSLPNGWEHGLRINVFAFTGQNDGLYLSGSKLPFLTKLFCGGCRLQKLVLEDLHCLKNLACSSNYLSELSLAGMPNLIDLDCSSNRITNLDLQHVPRLSVLNFRMNSVSTIDLMPVGQLTRLNCGRNLVSGLNLAHVPLLEELYCNHNRLSVLRLDCLPLLRHCDYWCNPLETVDFTEKQRVDLVRPDTGESIFYDFPGRPFFFYARLDDNVANAGEPDGTDLETPMPDDDETASFIAISSTVEDLIHALGEYTRDWRGDKEYSTSVKWSYYKFSLEQLIAALYEKTCKRSLSGLMPSLPA